MNIEMKQTKITVVGMGYIGLSTATLFASAGFRVNGYDINDKIINTLKKGEITIVEPHLQDLFSLVLERGNLMPTNEISESDIFIICVPTPYIEGNGTKRADLSYVEGAARSVSKVIRQGNIVILESTVPPGTTEDMMLPILQAGSGLKREGDFHVAHCPERILPGNMLRELRNNDRIIGVSGENVGSTVKALYDTVVTEGSVYVTDTRTAEMCKLVENTYRDVNIAFANELSVICDRMDIDVRELITLANRHPRVNIMKPGPGVGGHCLAIDPWFIVEKVPDDARLVRTARQINEGKPFWVIDKIEKDVVKRFGTKDIKIGVLGLAYKPDIDDLRESPAMEIAVTLKEKGYNVLACEPYARDTEVNGIPILKFADMLEEADYLVYAVAHTKFKEAHGLINSKPCFDAVGVLSKNWSSLKP